MKWWTRELLPVSGGGHLGLCLLLGAVATHLFVAGLGPDDRGFLFRGGVLQEALGQSLLILAPPLATYGGLRALLRHRGLHVPYLTVTGGAFLTLLTVTGLILAR